VDWVCKVEGCGEEEVNVVDVLDWGTTLLRPFSSMCC
jgi:hypothetical protein